MQEKTQKFFCVLLFFSVLSDFRNQSSCQLFPRGWSYLPEETDHITEILVQAECILIKVDVASLDIVI